MLRAIVRRLAERNIFEKRARAYIQNLTRGVSEASFVQKLNLDSNNVLSSPFPDVTGFENVYLHEVLWENVDKWPEKTAVVCAATGRLYRYGELRKLCGKLATSFRKNKLLPGDTIALILPNIPEFIIVSLAAHEAGMRTCLINSTYTSSEIRKLIDQVPISAFVTVPGKYADVKKSSENYSSVRYPIMLLNDGTAELPTGTIKLDEWMKADVEEFSKNEKTGIDYQDTILLPFSSGTTGLPKAVELTNRNLIANIKQFSSEYIFSGEEATNNYQEVIPLFLPLFHIYGLAVNMYNYLRVGAKLVCMPKFTASDFLNVLKQYRPTRLFVVPPIVQMMVNNEAVTPDHVKSVRTITCGAASLGKETISLLQQKTTPELTFLQGYGLTETSPMISYSKDASSEAVGYLVPNTQARIVKHCGENIGQSLGVGEVGELYVKGPQIMKGYYRNEKATSDTMDGDWLKTGDLLSFDNRGLLYIQGRLKELIKVKGFQVPPAELEELLRAFDKVEDVAVIGTKHEDYGEIPKAFIVRKSGVTINEEEIKNFVAERVVSYKQLGHVQFVERIPKSASGKILRRALMQQELK